MIQNEEIIIKAEGIALEGTLHIPTKARGVVIFAHGSGTVAVGLARETIL